MSSILNVLGKIPEMLKYSTVTAEQHERGELPGAPSPEQRAKHDARVKAEAAQLAKSNPVPEEDRNWRVELEELSRRFQGLPSTEQAEERLAALESEVSEKARSFEANIKQAYDSATTPFLTAWDKSQIERRVAELNTALADLHRSTRVKLAQAKALVETAKTWNPKRRRFQELSARKTAIDQATSTGSRSGFDRQDQLHPGSVDRGLVF